ncbi:hypothetical protein GQ457_15G000110 [Hibiscus cannabinus]
MSLSKKGTQISGTKLNTLARSPSSSGSIRAAAATTTFATSGSLPDDITPDFKVINEDDSQGIETGNLYLEGLSLHDGSNVSRILLGSGYIFDDQQELLHHYGNGSNIAEKCDIFFILWRGSYSASFLNLPLKPWTSSLLTMISRLAMGGGTTIMKF